MSFIKLNVKFHIKYASSIFFYVNTQIVNGKLIFIHDYIDLTVRIYNIII